MLRQHANGRLHAEMSQHGPTDLYLDLFANHQCLVISGGAGPKQCQLASISILQESFISAGTSMSENKDESFEESVQCLG